MPSRSRAPWRAAGPRGGGAGHEHQRGQAVAVGDGAVPAAVGWARWGWQQGFDERPQGIGTSLSTRLVIDGILPYPAERSETMS
jgi:hypothetical protein